MGTKRKITCQTFLEEMSNYLDGTLEETVRVSIEAHLAKCPNCWVVFDGTKRTVQIFQSMECQPLPEDVQERLLATLEEHWRKT
jgi:predicted anti-sigma-YlaC factor YlaD